MHKKARQSRALAKAEGKEPEDSKLHPVFGQIVGNMLLATTHPKGFSEGLKHQATLTVLTKLHDWVSAQPGRAVHIANDGTDVSFLFLEGGKECPPPFTS